MKEKYRNNNSLLTASLRRVQTNKETHTNNKSETEVNRFVY